MPEQMENYTDNQLVSFIQKGNSDAFVELTARYLSFIRAKAQDVYKRQVIHSQGKASHAMQPEEGFNAVTHLTALLLQVFTPEQLGDILTFIHEQIHTQCNGAVSYTHLDVYKRQV